MTAEDRALLTKIHETSIETHTMCRENQRQNKVLFSAIEGGNGTVGLKVELAKLQQSHIECQRRTDKRIQTYGLGIAAFSLCATILLGIPTAILTIRNITNAKTKVNASSNYSKPSRMQHTDASSNGI